MKKALLSIFFTLLIMQGTTPVASAGRLPRISYLSYEMCNVFLGSKKSIEHILVNEIHDQRKILQVLSDYGLIAGPDGPIMEIALQIVLRNQKILLHDEMEIIPELNMGKRRRLLSGVGKILSYSSEQQRGLVRKVGKKYLELLAATSNVNHPEVGQVREILSEIDQLPPGNPYERALFSSIRLSVLETILSLVNQQIGRRQYMANVYEKDKKRLKVQLGVAIVAFSLLFDFLKQKGIAENPWQLQAMATTLVTYYYFRMNDWDGIDWRKRKDRLVRSIEETDGAAYLHDGNFDSKTNGLSSAETDYEKEKEEMKTFLETQDHDDDDGDDDGNLAVDDGDPAVDDSVDLDLLKPDGSTRKKGDFSQINVTGTRLDSVPFAEISPIEISRLAMGPSLQSVNDSEKALGETVKALGRISELALLLKADLHDSKLQEDFKAAFMQLTGKLDTLHSVQLKSRLFIHSYENWIIEIEHDKYGGDSEEETGKKTILLRQFRSVLTQLKELDSRVERLLEQEKIRLIQVSRMLDGKSVSYDLIVEEFI